MKRIMWKTSLHYCETYQEEKLRAALSQAIEDLGGFAPYIDPGDRVLLKVNLLLSKGADSAATTHPAFVRELAKLLIEYGAKVVIGDSPGGLFNEEILRRNYRVNGMIQAAEESGASLNYNTGSRTISLPEGKLLKQLTQTAMLGDVDKVISVSKLKTHSMMTFTGAVKNMFGTVPGTKKAEYHFSMPDSDDFADALIDICMAAKPVLAFMDGIIGMEGNGPSGGTPRRINAVLASDNPFALDAVACHIIGLERPAVFTWQHAWQRGLAPDRFEEVEVTGEPVERFLCPDFRMPDHINPELTSDYGVIVQKLSHTLRPKVRFQKDKCIGCQACLRNCPAHAIRMQGKFPKADYHKCIRCYCCQELCPKTAIRIEESLIMKLVNRL